jgi:segregation and condensation protein B
MAGAIAAKARRKANATDERLFDRELEDLPAELRWREWMMRIEAVIFASAEPVSRETLARVVGKTAASIC